MPKALAVACSVALLLTSLTSSAADFHRVPPKTLDGTTWASYVAIDGEIRAGDYDRFKEFLLDSDNLWSALTAVHLSSPGGNVVEALKFANLFERAYFKTRVFEKCYSSCFIMFAGGVDRSLEGLGELGVHRISTRELELDIQRAKSQISPLAADVSVYLIAQGMPRTVVDKMSETPASQLFRIDHFTWVGSMHYSPVFIDTVDKACGRNPDPFPGKYVREAPRDAQTMDAIRGWVKCEDHVRLQNAVRFLYGEVFALKRGESSIAFPSGQYQRALKSVGE